MDWKKITRYSEKVVKVGSDMAEVIVHIQKPSLVGVAAVAARALNTINELAEAKSSTYFRDWSHMSVGFSRFLFEVTRTQRMVQMLEGQSNKAGKIWIGSVHGSDVGWVEWDGWVEGPWCRKGKNEETVRMLGRLVWEVLGPAVKVEPSLTGDTLASDSLTGTLPSKMGDDIYERAQKFIEAGYTRSVLLYGESGTGKSHIMRYVAKRAGGLTLRVKARQLSSLRDVAHAIKLLVPSAVIIDDLDRLREPEAILSEIEEIKGNAKLFLCSVNRLKKLDPAVLRANRFDEFVEVDKLGDEVLDGLIGPDVPDEIATKLRELPVCWVDEFHRQRTVLGMEEAIDEVTKLAERAELIKSMMGEDVTEAAPEGPETAPGDPDTMTKPSAD